MPTTENPRWTACRVALGREPTSVDFLEWMRVELQAYCDEHGIPRRRLLYASEPDHVTAWLQRRAEAQDVARERGEADLEGNGVAVVARRDEEVG